LKSRKVFNRGSPTVPCGFGDPRSKTEALQIPSLSPHGREIRVRRESSRLPVPQDRSTSDSIALPNPNARFESSSNRAGWLSPEPGRGRVQADSSRELRGGASCGPARVAGGAASWVSRWIPVCCSGATARAVASRPPPAASRRSHRHEIGSPVVMILENGKELAVWPLCARFPESARREIRNRDDQS